MRILILNWRDTKHAQAGGAEVYVHELAKRWTRQGHVVTLFCGDDGRSKRYEVVEGVNVIRRGSFYGVYFWAFVYYLWKLRGNYDVIIDCHNGIPFFTPLYARTPVYCVVHHVHQSVFAKYLPPAMAALAGFLEKTLMPLVYRNNRFITVSQSTKLGMVHELGIDPDQIEIIHNGVDLARLTPGVKADIPTVLYVGRLKAYKSVDVLIQAFAKVVDKQPDAQLLIAGTGDASDDLKQLARRLGISRQVSFLGRVSEARKVKLLQQAWVFVNPSYAEGWGITTIEANACGTPVIASDVAGLRDSVNAPSSGYLVTYGDANAFARKILLVLSNESRRGRLSHNAGRWASRFDWQASATSFYETISRPNGGRS